MAVAAVATILTILLTAINISLAVRAYWRERQTRRQPTPHPLEAAVRDVAAAFREWKA